MATTVAHAAAESSSDGKEASNKDTERRKMRLWDDKSDIQHGNRKRKKCTPYDLADFLAENRSNTGYKLRETVDEFLDRSGELFFAKRDSRDQLWQELESGFERARIPPRYLAQGVGRESRVWETWTPYDMAIFEAGVCANGKIFHKTRKLLPHKTINEIITFFYAWKASSHYHMWKKFKRNTYKVVGEEQRRKIQDKMEGFS
ncbi:hypothetical protein AAMO2058_001685300 [Amorphochlora amoebiformis]